LEELRKIFSLGEGDDLSSEILNVGFHIGWNRSAFEVIRAGHRSANFSVSDLNFVSDFELEARYVYHSTVYENVTVVNHLSSLEYGFRISKSPYARCESQLKKPQEVKARVAAHPLCLFEGVRKLLLKHIVVAADYLLGQKLLTVLGLSAILQIRSVLAGRVGAFGGRALRSSPDVVADGAANIGFSSSVGRH